MGPNILCYVTRYFLFCSYVAMSIFIRPWRYFLQFFYKRPRRTSTTFKVVGSHFVFYLCGALLHEVHAYCIKSMLHALILLINYFSSLSLLLFFFFFLVFFFFFFGGSKNSYSPRWFFKKPNTSKKKIKWLGCKTTTLCPNSGNTPQKKKKKNPKKKKKNRSKDKDEK